MASERWLRDEFRRLRAMFAERYPRAASVRFYLVARHYDAKAKARDLAWYLPDTHAVYFIRSSLQLSKNKLGGLLAHELGHSVRRDKCEQCADDDAERVTGRKIRYDRETLVQTFGRGLYPRPKKLHSGTAKP